MMQNNIEEAIEAYRQCRLRIQPGDINNYIKFTEAIATCYYNLGYYKKTRKTLRHIVSIISRYKKQYDPAFNAFLQKTAGAVVATYRKEGKDKASALDEELKQTRRFLGRNRYNQVYYSYFRDTFNKDDSKYKVRDRHERTRSHL